MAEGVNTKQQSIGAGRIWGALTVPGRLDITRHVNAERRAIQVRCGLCEAGLWVWEDQASDDAQWPPVLDMINRFLDMHRWHEGPKGDTAEPAKRNMLAEAGRLIAERDAKYGSVQKSFERIAQAFNALAPGARSCLDAEDVALLLVCMKLVRDSYSPENPDHLLDAAGYLGLLDQLRQASGPTEGRKAGKQG